MHDKALEAYQAVYANQVHPEERMIPPKEPTFLILSAKRAAKKGELIFMGTAALALGYTAFQFL